MLSFSLLLGVTSVISHLPRSFAAVQQLPHQVYNITGVEPPLAVAAVTATVNITTTDTSTITATTIATSVITTTLPPPPPPVSTLTVIYPSSDAVPVEVTSISQVVTSYIPEATWCIGPALYFASVPGAPFFNGSANVTQYVSGSSSCGVEYSTTTTTICATTLTGLASKVTVSECDQEITFSSECGYTLETPTPTPATTSPSALITAAPTVRRLMTYWLAPWQSLTAGEAPSDVDVKVCTVLDDGNMKCQRYQEVWEIVVVTSTVTTSFPVTFSRTLSGPGALIFDSSTSYINSTTEFISLSKTLRLETEVTIESTSTVTRSVVDPSLTSQEPASTMTITRHLEHVSSTPQPASSSSPETTPSTSLADASSTADIPSSSSSSSSSSSTTNESSSTPEPTTTVLITTTITSRRTSTVTKTRPRSRSGAVTISA
ncbi:uncharacterized protein EKO05_0003954 [Ascochyta rabiei]|uniref:Uncharacterized protein n=1 Tax=Didymella rabiei TaxID=5454 RepID=A0A163DXN8_DIDRA|nr:uncharacterized protein EKO05_0003954 [Ascochyta rabiei]KZM23406.1 hypothetical protein ST47_g5444 [Ascochyta rabiei]UPX13446.1 hypothetical protein EKO05_0003954 [Ascochyta rabiei]